MSAVQGAGPFRAALARLVPYEPGRPIELVRRELGLAGPVTKLASNEGIYGPMPAAAEAIMRSVGEANRYPDGSCWALRSALALHHDVPFECVVVANGADAVLNYLALAMLEPGDEVAFCWPSFPNYRINATKMGAVPVAAPLAGDDSAFDLDALLAAVTPRTKLAFVSNPNNPTGGMVRREALAAFLDALPEHVLPVIDEAYFEFVDDPGYPDTLREHVRAGRRVGVLRTFSKIYGLAGMRVGYGVLPADVAAACVKVKNAFDVSQVAQDAALASLGEDAEVARRRSEMIVARDSLCDGLRARGFTPLATVGNFAAVRVGDGAALAASLEREGVIVRPLAGFGDPASIRVTVGNPAEIERFLGALDAVGAGHD